MRWVRWNERVARLEADTVRQSKENTSSRNDFGSKLRVNPTPHSAVPLLTTSEAKSRGSSKTCCHPNSSFEHSGLSRRPVAAVVLHKFVTPSSAAFTSNGFIRPFAVSSS